LNFIEKFGADAEQEFCLRMGKEEELVKAHLEFFKILLVRNFAFPSFFSEKT
jgi:hypothetical protein